MRLRRLAAAPSLWRRAAGTGKTGEPRAAQQGAKGRFQWQLVRGAGSSSTSEVHGGDNIHRLPRLTCDFSVTTNALGPVPVALQAMRKLMDDVEIAWISPRGGDIKAILDEYDQSPSEQLASAPAVAHYPSRSDPELERLTAAFLRPDWAAEAQQRLLFGNGASELIDLLARAAPPGPYSLSTFADVMYREYQRACKNHQRPEADRLSEASLVCLVNPNNPTGDFLEGADLEAWITENCSPGTWVVVDESMLFWAGPDWHAKGISPGFMERMARKHIHVFLIQSWTKIFACTGLRIGTVVCPSPEKRELLESMQVPWSVNTFARSYLQAALQDREYLERTWRTTANWRSHIVKRLTRVYPSWKIYGQPWLPFIWIDTGSLEEAEAVYQTSLECGCPIRSGAHGYGKPSFIRIAVRRPYDFSVFYQALLQMQCKNTSSGNVIFGTYADVHPSVVESVRLVHIDDLLPHEEVLTDRAGKLADYVQELHMKILPAILIDSEYKVVIDGHHRLALFRHLGMNIVPVVSLNYNHEDILVNPPWKESREVTKESVIATAVRGKTLPPKSTQHMVRTRGGAVLPIIVLAPQIAELLPSGGEPPAVPAGAVH